MRNSFFLFCGEKEGKITHNRGLIHWKIASENCRELKSWQWTVAAASWWSVPKSLNVKLNLDVREHIFLWQIYYNSIQLLNRDVATAAIRKGRNKKPNVLEWVQDGNHVLLRTPSTYGYLCRISLAATNCSVSLELYTICWRPKHIRNEKKKKMNPWKCAGKKCNQQWTAIV